MEWKEIASTVIGGGAPIIGGLLGGPVGAKIGGVVASLLGCEEKPEAVQSLLATNPDAFVSLKKFELDHAKELRVLQLEEVKVYLQDVQNARLREMEIVKATGKPDINLYIIAWVLIIGFFTLCGMLIYVAIPEKSNAVVFMLFGTLSAGFSSVIGYFFGSSKSSSDKTALLSIK